MNDIQYQALREFEYMADRNDPEYILGVRENVAHRVKWYEKRYRKKLKKPFHHQTGKPLKENTLKQYKAEMEHSKIDLAYMDLAIQKLTQYDIIGDEKKSINEVLALYDGKVPKEEKPWLGALRKISYTWKDREVCRDKIICRLRTCQEDCILKDMLKDHFSLHW